MISRTLRQDLALRLERATTRYLRALHAWREAPDDQQLALDLGAASRWADRESAVVEAQMQRLFAGG